MTENTIKIVMPKLPKPEKREHKHKHKHEKHEAKENYKTEIKEEITKLEEQKKSMPKGIRGFLGNLSINKKISDRKNYLNTDRNIAVTKKQIELTKLKTELENEKAKLKEMNDRRSVDFGSLGGISEKKSLKLEDLY